MENVIFEFIVLNLDDEQRYRILILASEGTSKRALNVQVKKDLGTKNYIEQSDRMVQPADFGQYLKEMAKAPMVMKLKEI
ncbi:hypothetical protein [Rhizosphaericola mali]|uniref:Uncharacterized protein n=1 Tax=Rhizosphaericola mali TaxID=2545455 RepID=A0A5P2FXU4_9BACT|nr:hypothetical protein [Rhizosphaericola mali]QES87208.1 hypothetical protein E0W69_000530 [Rhizosphaericola mali]